MGVISVFIPGEKSAVNPIFKIHPLRIHCLSFVIDLLFAIHPDLKQPVAVFGPFHVHFNPVPFTPQICFGNQRIIPAAFAKHMIIEKIPVFAVMKHPDRMRMLLMKLAQCCFGRVDIRIIRRHIQ